MIGSATQTTIFDPPPSCFLCLINSFHRRYVFSIHNRSNRSNICRIYVSVRNRAADPTYSASKIDLGPTFNLFSLFNAFNLLNPFDVFDLFDLLCILKTYLLWNELMRQRKHKGGGLENRGFSRKSNYKVECVY